MAASKWKPIFKAQPVDAEKVYIRKAFPNPPVLATWSLADQQFVLDNGLAIPWHAIEDWRPQ